jgi:hypothetical protein
MKRTELKRGNKPLKRAPMKRTPSKRAKADAAALDAVTPEVLRRSQGRCEARVPGVCASRGAHRHHRRRVRSDNRVENILYVCLPCHGYIHANVSWSMEHGFLVKRTADPTVIPVGTFRVLISKPWPTRSSSRSRS